MTAPYLYVTSRFGKVPWMPTVIELFSEHWEEEIMGKCEDCKHWRMWEPTAWGMCENNKFYDSILDQEGLRMHFMDTNAEFGCTLLEEEFQEEKCPKF